MLKDLVSRLKISVLLDTVEAVVFDLLMRFLLLELLGALEEFRLVNLLLHDSFIDLVTEILESTISQLCLHLHQLLDMSFAIDFDLNLVFYVRVDLQHHSDH